MKSESYERSMQIRVKGSASTLTVKAILLRVLLFHFTRHHTAMNYRVDCVHSRYCETSVQDQAGEESIPPNHIFIFHSTLAILSL